MVTIYDIAKTTGHSASTVSKVLNGTGKISEKTREKILTTAKELGYLPNIAARSLTTKKSNLVGIIFEDEYMLRGFDHPLFSGVLNKIRSELETAGYDLIFLSHNFNLGKRTYLEHCIHRNVDGVIVINPLECTDNLISLTEAGIPCVSTNDIIAGIPFVLTENKEAGFKACEYFIKKGHKHIGYIGGSYTRNSVASQERLEGMKEALQYYNYPIDDSYIEQCSSWTTEAGHNGMKNLYKRHHDITAIFVASDNLCFGAMDYCHEAGLSIPKDISLIGFDDDNISSRCNPPLTTFKQNDELIGQTAAQLLLQKIAGQQTKTNVRIPATLIERNSVSLL